MINLTGVDFPKDLSNYKLVVQCDSCMFTKRYFLSMLKHVKEQEVLITNFGIALTQLNGIPDRSCDFLIEN
jgi:hypothetical protein